MTDKSTQDKDIDKRLSDLEYSIRHLEYRMDKEIPNTLAVIDPKFEKMEQKLESEINSLKKDLADAKASMRERLTFVTIIVALIIALVTVTLKIIKG